MSQKKILLFISLFLSSFLFGQDKQKAEEAKVGAYNVRTFINADKTFGFEIIESGKTVVHQQYKPFTTLPEGFKSKNNALLVAKHIAGRLQKNKDDRQTFISSDEAKKMGVTNEDLKN